MGDYTDLNKRVNLKLISEFLLMSAWLFRCFPSILHFSVAIFWLFYYILSLLQVSFSIICIPVLLFCRTETPKSKFALKDHVWCNKPSIWYLKVKHRRELGCVSVIFYDYFLILLFVWSIKCRKILQKFPQSPVGCDMGMVVVLSWLFVCKHKGEKNVRRVNTLTPSESQCQADTHTCAEPTRAF